MVDPPSVEDTLKILNNIKSKYEDYHNVNYNEEAIDACVKLSDRYITDRLLPDKAIDVMDEVGARVHLKNINVPQEILDLEKKIEDIKNEKNKVEIRVKDNGNGIPQKIVDKIFQPFFTTKPTGQGTGLGLSLAYDIVTKGHGGELKVETKEGEGSEFIIQLPAN